MDGLVRNISRTGRVISYTFYIVVTGASDGIGKAYAMQVRTVCVIPIPAVSLVWADRFLCGGGNGQSGFHIYLVLSQTYESILQLHFHYQCFLMGLLNIPYMQYI